MTEEKTILKETYNVIIDKFTSFPGVNFSFNIRSDFQLNACKKALAENNGRIALLQGMVIDEESPTATYSSYGVVVKIDRLIPGNRGSERVTIVQTKGLYAFKVDNVVFNSRMNCFQVTGERHDFIDESETDPVKSYVYKEELYSVTKYYHDNYTKNERESFNLFNGANSLIEMIANVIGALYLSPDKVTELLSCDSVFECAKVTIAELKRLTLIRQAEREIEAETNDVMRERSLEVFLREQMRIISEKLGDDESNKADEYISKISDVGFEYAIYKKLKKQAEKLRTLPQGSHDIPLIENYLDTVLSIPWFKYSEDTRTIKEAREILDRDHYGLTKVKDRILQNIAVEKWDKKAKKGQILCLVGPPGVGKTSIAHSVADALGREYERIALGGVHDESEIRGHRKTYIGAMPGRIATAISKLDTMNPVIVLDEIDKLGQDGFKGDPSSALLEVLDGEQNHAFMDNFLEIPLDLSKVLFIATANDMRTIPKPLLDRMEVIELGSYTAEEKYHIAKNHLIPKQLKKYKISAAKLHINKSAINKIIECYTAEAGVRNLEQHIATICRKAIEKFLLDRSLRISVNEADVEEYLGKPKYKADKLAPRDEVGLVNGLAWTSVGGTMLPIEVLVTEGEGIEVTGSLGDVMKESSKLAVTLARSLAGKYEYDPLFIKNRFIHIHAPEGAVPKDGPSAGVTMTTALVSALSGIPVRRDVAMTGEISLRGKVLPIGGLREKTMAAYRAGIRTVIIPKDNEPDLQDVDETVRKNLQFVLAEDINDVLDNALTAKASREKPGYAIDVENVSNILIPTMNKIEVTDNK